MILGRRTPPGRDLLAIDAAVSPRIAMPQATDPVWLTQDEISAKFQNNAPHLDCLTSPFYSDRPDRRLKTTTS